MDVLWVAVIAFAFIGLSTLIWTTAGFGRIFAEAWSPRDARRLHRFTPDRVAVIIAAHDEQLVIADTIRSAATQVSLANTFVVSDGSRDETEAVARQHGATVLAVAPNRGKAGAIRAGVEGFHIAERFDVLVLLDADTRLRADYLETGLPLFDDEEVVAVAGRATTHARTGALSPMGRFLTDYRERTYLVTQYLQKFGQATRKANAVTIVPGFASMYRTDILDRMDIDAPGLAIEDFNMTFEVHRKRLGRIDFHPNCAIAETQDPTALGDYMRQMKRWSLGFWQTVRRHGPHVGVFWASLALFIAEVVISSVLLVLVLPALAVAALAMLASGLDGQLGDVARTIATVLPFGVLAVGYLLSDFFLTAVAALSARRWPRPGALLFPLMRVLDAALCLKGLVGAFGQPSDGRWQSPERRDMAEPARPTKVPLVVTNG